MTGSGYSVYPSANNLRIPSPAWRRIDGLVLRLDYFLPCSSV
jgi:hypothetical protein